MKNIFLFILTFFFVLYSFSQKPTIFGGNMEVTQIDSNEFILSVAVQIDSFQIMTMNIEAYDILTDTLVKTFSISLDSTKNISLGYQTHAIDTISVYYLSDTFTIPDNPNGYYYVNTEYSRIKNLFNFINGQYVFFCEVPDPAISMGNSTPKFSDFSDSMFLKLNELSEFSFSCFDKDGDSLVYSFFQPLNNSMSAGGKPFSLLPFRTGHNLNNMVGPGSSCTVWPQIGQIYVRPSRFGKYSLSVRCEEFRNGAKLGEVHKDLTLCSYLFYTSMNENKESNDINIFPNPSNGNFTLSFDSDKEISIQTEIVDLTGKIVFTSQLNSSNTELNLAHLPKGMYLVKLRDNNSQLVKRIIIQ